MNIPLHSWRQQLRIHPAALLLPAFPKEKLILFGRNIRANGMLKPITLLAKVEPGGKLIHRLLDGVARLDAAELVGIKLSVEWSADGQLIISAPDCAIPAPDVIAADETFDPYEYVCAVNVARRHLSNEDKRKLVHDLLEARPELADRAIARCCCVHHDTVAEARRKSNGGIRHKPDRVEASGRKARGRKPGTAGAVGKVGGTDRVQPQPVQPQPVQTKVVRPARVLLDGWVDRIITLASEASALLIKPTPSNVESVRRKLSEIRNLARNGPQPDAIAPAPTLRRALELLPESDSDDSESPTVKHVLH